jgi:hypothetical protein
VVRVDHARLSARGGAVHRLSRYLPGS